MKGSNSLISLSMSPAGSCCQVPGLLLRHCRQLCDPIVAQLHHMVRVILQHVIWNMVMRI